MSNIFIEPMGLPGGLQPQSQPLSPQISGSSKPIVGSAVAGASAEGEPLPESFSLALAEPTMTTKAEGGDPLVKEPLLNGVSVEASVDQGADGLTFSSDVLTTGAYSGDSSVEQRALFPKGIADGANLPVDGVINGQEAMIPEVAENAIAIGSIELDAPAADEASSLMMASASPLSWRASVLNRGNTDAVVLVEGAAIRESGNAPTSFLPQQPLPGGLAPQAKITEVEPAMQGAVTSVLAAAINNKSAAVLGPASALENGEVAGEVTSESNGSILAKTSGANAPMQSLVKNMTQDGFAMELGSANVTDSGDETIDVKPSATTTTAAVNEKLTASTHNAEAKVVVQANVRVGMPGWADQIAERTASLVSQNIKQAEIQLNPQEMGSINVKISVTQEQAAVTFTVANGAVREALDQTLQRLRENFESEGMDLVQADVRDERQAQSEDGAEGEAFNGDAEVSEDADGDEVMTVAVESSGVDHFV